MKRILLILSVFVCMQASAQLLNGSFEDWSVFSLDKLDGYQTSQEEATYNGLSEIFVSSIIGHTGNAVKLETHEITDAAMEKDTVFSYIANTVGDPSSGEGGSPYALKPSVFSFWANYDVKIGDAALVYVVLKNAGSGIISTTAYPIMGSSSSTWVQINIPITYDIDETPDSVIIAFASSNPFGGGSVPLPGSILMVDDLAFDTGGTIDNPGMDAWTTTNYDVLDDWDSGDAFESEMYGHGKIIEKTTDVVDGSSALKFTVQGDVDEGWAFTNFSNKQYDDVTGKPFGGSAFTAKKGSLTGAYKFIPIDPLDSIRVNVELSLDGAMITGAEILLPAQATYTDFSLDFDFSLMPISPDSVYVYFNATKLMGGAATSAIGNVMYLDSLSLNAKPELTVSTPVVVCSPIPVDLTDGTSSNVLSIITYYTDALLTSSVVDETAVSSSGTYYVLAETAAGFRDTASIAVTINPKPTVLITEPAAVCESNTIDLTESAVTAGSTAGLSYTYFIDGGATNLLSSPESVSSTGLYYIVGADVYGCSDTASVSTTINPLPIATISGTTSVCKLSTAPEVTFTAANGTGPYTFTYTVNGISKTVTTTSGNSVTVSQSTAIPYVYVYELVSVQDAGSACINFQTGSATITVNALPTATITGTTAVCEDAVAPEVSFTAYNGSAPYTFTYTINSGVAQTVTTVSGSTVKVSQPTTTPGDYVYDLVSVQESSSTACSNLQTGTTTITVNSNPTLVITDPDAKEEPFMVDITADAVTAGSTADLYFSYWTDPETTSVLSFPQMIANSGTYYIKGHTLAGCTDTAAVTVTINPSVDVALVDAAVISIKVIGSNLVIKASEAGQYELIDLTGSVVSSGIIKEGETRIPISLEGLFVVTVVTNKAVLSKKVLF